MKRPVRRPWEAAVAIVLAAGIFGCTAAAPDQAPSSATSGAPAATTPPAASAPATPATTPEAAPPDADASAPGTYVDYEDGILETTDGVRALFFHAPWCPQCRALEESILAGEIPPGLTIIKVDFDSETALRQEYGVTLQTTIVYLDDDGTEAGSAVLYEDTTLAALVASAP